MSQSRLGSWRPAMWAILALGLLWSAAAAGEERLPPPGPAAQREAQMLIREVFKDDLAAVRKPEDKVALARKLMEKAAASRSDVAGQFALLRLAIQMTSEAGDGAATFRAIDELGRVFQIDGVGEKVTALPVLLSSGLTTAQSIALAGQIDGLIDEAIAADRYDLANQVVSQMQAWARRINSPDLVRQVGLRMAEVRAAEASFAAAKKATATLQEKPDDPDAHLKVGRYECFVQGRWTTGLPHLAAGSDAELKALAQSDLQKPTAADEQARLADTWWTLADKQTGTAKRQMRERAVQWYQQAIPGLTGLVKARAEKRVETAGLADAGDGRNAVPVFLSDLPEKEVKVYEGRFGKNGNLRWEDQRIVVGKEFSPHGLSTHPAPDGPAHVAYDLSKRFSIFMGGVAISDDTPHSRSPLTFRILGDGKELWRSQAVQDGGRLQKFRISVAGVSKLELLVESLGPIDRAHAVWVEPMVIGAGK